MTEPRKALEAAGAQTSLVSPAKDEVQGWKHFAHADRFQVDVPLDQAKADEFDALRGHGPDRAPIPASPAATDFHPRARAI